MKNKAILVSFLAAGVLCAAEAPAERKGSDAAAEAPAVEREDSFFDRYIDLSTEIAFYSAYVWRGQILFDRPVWQPAQNVLLKLGENAEYGALKARFWANFAIDGNKPPHRFGGMSIVDERVGYVKTFFDCLDFDVGAIFYQFPNRHSRGMRETDEAIAGVRWRNPYVTPSFYVWWDFDENGHNDENSLFFDFDFARAFAITEDLSLNVGSGFGVANGSYMDHYTRGGVDGVAFNYFHSDLGLWYKILGNVKVGASLTYFYNLSRQVRHSSYDMHDHYNAGILRGGMHLAVSW
ncbi:MAG: hypothetical protein IJ658_11460 [Kiritimatiellae bacterium]|nr:hypothetical protein [Kiritimatiellia bacterium]